MIYNIYKPKDFSSFSVVKQIKRITHEKVGHSGTLDPFADGVLVLGVGKSTKKLSDIIQYDKTYEGVIKLGEQTDTKDLTGSVINTQAIPNMENIDLDAIAKSFLGVQMQDTPMYSARKVNDPIVMASAMKHAIIAGRKSYLAGRMMKKAYASASSPMENLI